MTVTASPFVSTARAGKSSVKWTRYPADVIPLSVAEMDFGIAPSIEYTIIDHVRAADFGYIDAPGPLANAFAAFAETRWKWIVDPGVVRVTTDVSVAIVEALRYGIPRGGRVVITPPVYDAFPELVREAGAVVHEVPMLVDGTGWRLDLDGLERAFAGGADAFLLCSPHNPVGIVFDHATLDAVAELAARYDVLVLSDEVHAPLTYPGEVFVPFAVVAARHGARSITVTSASKGWNIAGLKCAILVAGDDHTVDVLDRFPDEVTCRTSILGLNANAAAFAEKEWLDDVRRRIRDNDSLLADLLQHELADAVYHRPAASYLGWVDLGAYATRDHPATLLLDEARVAVNPGSLYGSAYRDFIRINFATDPETLHEAIDRISGVLLRV